MRPLIPIQERSIDNDLVHLLSNLPRAPKLIQAQFLPYLRVLQKQQPNNTRLANYLEQHPIEHHQPLPNAGPLVHNYAQLLQPKALLNRLDSITQYLESTSTAQSQSQSKKLQELIIERLELLYPDYDSYYRMSKQEKSHLAQYHPKNKNRDFFTEPRLINRFEQFAHFKNNDQHKGDIVYVHYHGQNIASGKVQLVANQQALELWAQQSNNFPIPVLTLPTEEELEKKKEEEKKEKQKPEEVLNPLKLQFQHKFVGHTAKITSVSLSQDEFYAVTGSADRTARLWCLRMKMCLAVFRGHTRTIWDVHFSPSGLYFLTGSADKLMLLWKTDEPNAQRAYQHDADIYKVSFAKDPAYVVSCSQDASVRIWSTLEATLIRKIQLNQPVLNFNLGFSGAYLIAVEGDGRVSVINLFQGKVVNSFYFYDPQGRQKEDQTLSTLMIHDVCLSEDERELSVVCGHYLLIYNMQKLEKKTAKNIYTFYRSNADNDNLTLLEPREVLYLGAETNLTHCQYLSRNVLMIAGTSNY